mgnify:CR=1 FL=1
MTLKKLLHNFNGHLHTVNSHRRLVRKYCFKLGLYRQGMMHDLSKVHGMWQKLLFQA